MPRSKKSESVKSKETLDRSNAINLKKRMKRISYIERLKNTDTVFKHPISYLGHNFQNFVLFKQYNKGELVVPAKDCLASIIKISPKCIYIFLSRVKGLKIKPSIVFFKVGQKKQTPLSASDLKKVLIHAKEQFPRFTTNIRDIACKWLDASGGKTTWKITKNSSGTLLTEACRTIYSTVISANGSLRLADLANSEEKSIELSQPKPPKRKLSQRSVKANKRHKKNKKK